MATMRRYSDAAGHAGYGSVQVVRDLDEDGDLDFVLRSDAVYLMINAGDAVFSRLDLPAIAGRHALICEISTAMAGWT